MSLSARFVHWIDTLCIREGESPAAALEGMPLLTYTTTGQAFIDGNPEVNRLLCEAVPYLAMTFGGQTTITITLDPTPDLEQVRVVVIILLSSDHPGNPADMLGAFWDTWWRANRARAKGHLVFTCGRARPGGETLTV
mgnify:CR=1 FL=1